MAIYKQGKFFVWHVIDNLKEKNFQSWQVYNIWFIAMTFVAMVVNCLNSFDEALSVFHFFFHNNLRVVILLLLLCSMDWEKIQATPLASLAVASLFLAKLKCPRKTNTSLNFAGWLFFIFSDPCCTANNSMIWELW